LLFSCHHMSPSRLDARRACLGRATLDSNNY
jgi:hypothetical protein